MHKLNILFFASWWPIPESPFNGVFIKELANTLSKRYRVTVVYWNKIEKSNKLSNINGNFKLDLIEQREFFKVFELNGEIFLRRFGNLERRIVSFLVKELLNKQSFDIIHVNVLPSRFGKLIVKSAKKFKLPMVLTEHSSYYHREIFFENDTYKKKNELISLLNSDLKFIMPVSRDLAKILEKEYLVSAEKIKIIPNISNNCFKYQEYSSRDKYINIVLVALWEKPKNPVLFLKVLLRLKIDKPDVFKNIRLHWIGEGSLMAEVKDFLNQHLPDLLVEFYGVQPKEFISSIFVKSQFLVHPSSAENLPCVIIESLCCGCPVLSASINGVVELVNDLNGLLYKVDDEDSFYSKFLEMIDGLKKFNRKEISENACKIYSEDAVLEMVSEVYNMIL